VSSVYLFYVLFAGLGLGLGTAGLDYKTDYFMKYVAPFNDVANVAKVRHA